MRQLLLFILSSIVARRAYRWGIDVLSYWWRELYVVFSFATPQAQNSGNAYFISTIFSKSPHVAAMDKYAMNIFYTQDNFMPCNLTIAGKNFDIPSFLSVTRLRILKKRIKGEPRSLLRPNGEKLPYSFLTIETSKADFRDLNTQVKDTIKYLKRHRNQLLHIKKTKGIDQISLDFGIEFSNGQFSQQIFMPGELVSLTAEFGISIQVSVYGENFGS